MLVLVTVLSLLPTSALAASSTGTGIKPTNNTNYWTTRLLHDGTPYSYKPPMAAGKMLYCMDRGYGYRWGTASFLNSYTYTSATGADADAVLKTALAQSGMGELDAQQLENFKWMMTYIVDYKGDIPGSLFMAAQTYVWDHQTFKGEGDGDIDGGGYANADTYETYLGYIDWMLAEKAKEDAAFQKQIEEYAAQGVIATVVEDDTAKWAVWAKSSVKGRQSFFNYYAPRKLSLEAQPGEPDIPPAGTGDITLKKVAAGTTRGLDGARFLIYRDGQIVGSDVTANGGIIEVNDVTKGLWSFVETEAPVGYCADSTPISVYVDTTDGDKQYSLEEGGDAGAGGLGVDAVIGDVVAVLSNDGSPEVFDGRVIGEIEAPVASLRGDGVVSGGGTGVDHVVKDLLGELHAGGVEGGPVSVVLLFGVVLRIHLQSIEYQLAILVVVAEAHEEPDAIGRYI